MIDERAIGERFRAVAGTLDERQRRIWAAAAARSHGRGGIAAVARASGMAQNTVRRGLRELDCPQHLPVGRVRKAGAGPKRRTDTDRTLLSDLKRLVDGETRGDPERPLLWTSKSVRELAKGLRGLGHEVSYRTVARLLHSLGFSLQANRKTKEGSQHPDRDAQFRHINNKVTAAVKENRPAISIDTKKKELVGEYKNSGAEWRPKGDPVAVNVHDFPDKTLGKAIPYGIYDIGANNGFVNVGITKETAAFAVASIRGWWQQFGHARYTDATTLQITADCGGGNGNRVRLWKTELQRLVDDTGLQISVCHFPPPPGTSKWNKIEHRLWSFIAKNWRGRPLVSHEVIINSIAATKTDTGLEVYAQLDERDYPQGIEVSDAQLAAVNLHRDEFHGEWNYTIKPSTQ
ncbi:MAG: ISAzo13 family transposase [Solirubrobacteraceae bacterium]